MLKLTRIGGFQLKLGFLVESWTFLNLILVIVRFSDLELDPSFLYVFEAFSLEFASWKSKFISDFGFIEIRYCFLEELMILMEF